MITRRFLLESAAAAAAYSAQGFRGARAENAPGVTDTEIKIGQTMAYSGPASAYGVIGRAEAASNSSDEPIRASSAASRRSVFASLPVASAKRRA
jgi:hypothetical protein